MLCKKCKVANTSHENDCNEAQWCNNLDVHVRYMYMLHDDKVVWAHKAATVEMGFWLQMARCFIPGCSNKIIMYSGVILLIRRYFSTQW